MLRATAGAAVVATGFGAVGSVSANEVATGQTLYTRTLSGVHAFDAETGEEIWTAAEDSVSQSPPTVVDGVVYCGGSVINALEAATGDEVWTSDPFGGGAFVSGPTVVNGMLYIGRATEIRPLYAIDAETGDEIWEFTGADGRIDGAPHVVDGVVYVGSEDGSLYALDADTGSLEWAFSETNGEAIYGSPSVIDDVVVFGTEARDLYAVDTGTGELSWSLSDDLIGNRASPTVADGQLYVGDDRFGMLSEGTLVALSSDGSESWATDSGGAAVTVAGDFLYTRGYSSGIRAFDRSSGEQLWHVDTVGATPTLESIPAVVGDRLYTVSGEEGGDSIPITQLVALDANSGEQQWAVDDLGPDLGDGIDLTGQAMIASPTVVDDPDSGDSIDSRVLLGTDGHHDRVGFEHIQAPSGEGVPRDGTPAGDGAGGADDGDDADDDGPGFGIAAAVAGVGGAAAVAAHLRKRD